MQQMAEIPRALGFTDDQIQDALAVSTVGEEGQVMNPFSSMGISDHDYVEMLQGIALKEEGKRGLEVVLGDERAGKRARFQPGEPMRKACPGVIHANHRHRSTSCSWRIGSRLDSTVGVSTHLFPSCYISAFLLFSALRLDLSLSSTCFSVLCLSRLALPV